MNVFVWSDNEGMDGSGYFHFFDLKLPFEAEAGISRDLQKASLSSIMENVFYGVSTRPVNLLCSLLLLGLRVLSGR